MSETYTPITWDDAADRKFEYGVKNAVVYIMDDDGEYTQAVAWNGIINITDSPEGADLTKFWADNMEYAGMRAAEEYKASVEAYTYPPEFAACDGSAEPIPGVYMMQQERKKFALCWRTEQGNANTENLGYKIHVAYGLTASPTEKSHDTVNDSPDAATFSWDMDGMPVPVTGYKSTAKLEFDSTKMTAAKMTKLKEILYGTTTAPAELPLPDELFTTLRAVTEPTT